MLSASGRASLSRQLALPFCPAYLGRPPGHRYPYRLGRVCCRLALSSLSWRRLCLCHCPGHALARCY